MRMGREKYDPSFQKITLPSHGFHRFRLDVLLHYHPGDGPHLFLPSSLRGNISTEAHSSIDCLEDESGISEESAFLVLRGSCRGPPAVAISIILGRSIPAIWRRRWGCTRPRYWNIFLSREAVDRAFPCLSGMSGLVPYSRHLRETVEQRNIYLIFLKNINMLNIQ